MFPTRTLPIHPSHCIRVQISDSLWKSKQKVLAQQHFRTHKAGNIQVDLGGAEAAGADGVTSQREGKQGQAAP